MQILPTPPFLFLCTYKNIFNCLLLWWTGCNHELSHVAVLNHVKSCCICKMSLVCYIKHYYEFKCWKRFRRICFLQVICHSGTSHLKHYECPIKYIWNLPSQRINVWEKGFLFVCFKLSAEILIQYLYWHDCIKAALNEITTKKLSTKPLISS